MPRRRTLQRISDFEAADLPFHRVPSLSEEERGRRGRRDKGMRVEAGFAFIAILFTMIVAVLTLMGYIDPKLVATLAFSMLMMSALLMVGNYLIKVGKLTKNAQIYFWIFAISMSLLTLYLVVKGILPLAFGGILGVAQFEEFISWIAYVMIALLAVGVIIVAFLTPGESEEYE